MVIVWLSYGYRMLKVHFDSNYLALCDYYLSVYDRCKESVMTQLTHAMHVKDIYVNGTFLDKLTKWQYDFDWILVILFSSILNSMIFKMTSIYIYRFRLYM